MPNEDKYKIPLKGRSRKSGVQLKSQSMSDIPNRMLRAQQEDVYISEKQYKRKVKKGEARPKKNVEKQKPLSTALAKVQSPDLDCNSFQQQALDITVPAGETDYTVLEFKIPNRVRAVIKKYGWYTTNPGSANIEFGLYVGGSLVAPGSPRVSSNPKTQQDFQPSGLSIDFENLSDCHHPVDPQSQVQIKVNNLDAANAYSVWGHVWGWLWLEEKREAGQRAYIDEMTGKII